MSDDKTQETISEQQFLIELIYKSIDPGLKLRPEESQLFLAYIGEMLREIEAEEKLILQKDVTANASKREGI